jgi:Leucine-rich repeat (LRR) protein
MFGLDSYVERIEILVTSEQSDAAPRYVGVWGMGGVGKTLLLQRVHGSPKVHGHFEGAKFIWRTVGQTPDIMALYWSLSVELGLEPENTAIAEDYKFKLFNHFRRRRVFLVLDDVWKDEAFVSLDLARGKGSVILLSTRNQLLLDRPTPHITQEHMTRLSEEDSWSLFCVHAFRPSSNVPCELVPLAQSIAEECQGLPLALKVIGRAIFEMSSRKFEWVSLLKKLRESRMQERTVEEKLYERLKLGYDLLSEDDYRLKQCFHYFAAFPEDSTILFEEILFHWTGEGLVPAHDGDDPTADAFSLLKKLWKRSFIESNGQFDSDECYLLTFKVHDVMRDLAFYLLKKDVGTLPAKQLYLYQAGRNLDEIPKEWTKILEVVRLSLHSNNLKTLPRRFCAPKLVTLLLGHNPIISLSASFSSNFPKLSVLNLSNGQFRYLPEELGNLKNLVYLDLTDCGNLKSLPDTVRKLRLLKFLILDDCGDLKYLPSGMIDLTSLQILHTGGCGSLTWAEHTLSGRARAKSVDHVNQLFGASLEDICGLSNLTELTIFASANSVPPNNVSALTKLKLLQVWFNIKTLPAGLAYQCKQLQEIDLIFSHLVYLPTTFTLCGAFPALIRLQLYNCALVEFPEVNQGALPKLQTLDFTGSYNLESLPLSLELLTSLRRLIVTACTDKLKNSCRINCEKSTIWRKFNIQYSGGPIYGLRARKYMFSKTPYMER